MLLPIQLSARGISLDVSNRSKERLSSDGAVGQNVRRAAYTSDIKIMKIGLMLLIYMKGATSITLKHAFERELGTKSCPGLKAAATVAKGACSEYSRM
jgi:hypothetical protein